ncbi:CDP-diacylglycerol-Inositol 3-phosphatidyltransferase [Acrasis kona]|uniref:CDP-diacylglycerol--inositol 3-phosphatidyltransferase n=1 Tax=Acrasis kona TaxID=1008807 RepID=A0AAW2Z5X5_9EUKA
MAINHTKIYTYVPNLIGFGRVLCSLIAFFIYDTNPGIFLVLYTTSFLLDALDGEAARRFNQTSRFGAVLDMVTDRFSTAALVTLLSHLYPNKPCIMGFIMLNILDFVSHWVRMYSSMVNNVTSHKNTSVMTNPLLRVYYGNRTVMGVLCLGNELFYIWLYALYFYHFSTLIQTLAWILLIPTWGAKQLMNVIQLYDSAESIVKWEYENDPHHKSK